MNELIKYVGEGCCKYVQTPNAHPRALGDNIFMTGN